MADLDLVTSAELIQELIARCDVMVLYYCKDGDHMPNVADSLSATCYLWGPLPILLSVSDALIETLCTDPAELEEDPAQVFKEKLAKHLDD